MNHIDIDVHRALSELDDPRRDIALKRNTAIDLVSALIDFLDLTDGDPDLEPSLGSQSPEYARVDQADLEADDCDLEPLLGAPEIPATFLQRGGRYGWHSVNGSQEHWAAGRGNMEEESAEAEDAGGGDIQDEPHDGELDLWEGEATEDLEEETDLCVTDNLHDDDREGGYGCFIVGGGSKI